MIETQKKDTVYIIKLKRGYFTTALLDDYPAPTSCITQDIHCARQFRDRSFVTKYCQAICTAHPDTEPRVIEYDPGEK